jgi:hypothetical protein
MNIHYLSKKKRCNKEVFGNVEEWKKSLLEEIRVLDGLEDERLLVEEEFLMV